ncbi:sensor histidine kinase [Paenibacillus pabuli]|uniref:sensor histidine kinase n=1 Tax=Paenibacillus pabuli TaxID=1472 RepID=UPI0007806AF8|nr:sensor histidine kinase [Paenibacillus pabuli]MEC0123134.1 sensor histidine kinase [Paenibacillus pabuli]
MKLLIREHWPLFVMHLVQLTLVVAVYWLDGYRNVYTALYSIFLGMVTLLAYTGWRYISHRKMYDRLAEPLNELDKSAAGSGSSAPIAQAVDQLLQAQYALYMTRIMEMERRRREHSTFITQWVHQMKTPLSVIHLLTENESDRRQVDIRDEADRIQWGLETVLHATRLETFEEDFQAAHVPLKRVVRKTVNEHKRLFIVNNLYPQVQIDDELTVPTDEKWIGFVLTQLLSNAIKYSAGCGRTVAIRAWRQGAKTVLEVADEGIGIPLADLKRVTRPFYTGESGRKFRESTGMGLHLAQEVCNRLGHELEIDSTVDVGTRVRVYFLTAVKLTSM